MFLLFLIAWIALQQSPQAFPDSIRKVISETNDDSLKSSLFYDLSKHYYGLDQDTAIFYAENSIRLAEKLGLEKIKGNALNIKGVAQLIRSDYEDALKTHLQALKIREALQDSVGMLESNLNIGNVYYRNGEMGKAAQMYEKALVYGLATKNLRGQSLIYNNLANYHKDRWSQNQSKEDFDLALSYLQKSLAIKEELNDQRGLVNTLAQLSDLSLAQEDTKKAKAYLDRALSIAEATQDVENKLSVLNQLSGFHLKAKDFKRAKDYGLQAFDIAKNANSQFYISVTAGILVEAALGLNDYKSAYEFLAEQKIADQVMFNESRQKVREELLIQYETEKKELENQRLIQEQEYLDLSIRRRNEILIGAVLLLVFLGIMIWIQQKNHRKLKQAHDELEEAHQFAKEQNAQIQLQASDLHETNLELTKANQFRDKIFSVISHDLRAPFSSLHSIIKLWDLKLLTEEELREIMPMVARDTHALSQMLNNLLIWSKEQMDSQEFEMSSFDLEELVAENIKLLKPQADQKNLDLSFEIPSGIELKSDRERLNFILRNILTNAIKFTPAQGKILVDFPDSNEIRITDTGLGISPEKLSLLFNHRVNSQKGTEGESGTGIGLMLSKEFAESIGAKILVESELGKGTVFRILLQEGKMD
ncbi:hypothetical protein D0X99_12310 [Algoriphagus lacus]|uniref:histidine kinase n=1 Tax=Algoriphagus lacus TaxID=2056311 RepID=A0A418PRK0_9BACT|nr:ATP-binding protein [Algoriphagus lacus]RIW15217.1 hypothetical protein D0X99_12310 [Algoriphagus lacus]